MAFNCNNAFYCSFSWCVRTYVFTLCIYFWLFTMDFTVLFHQSQQQQQQSGEEQQEQEQQQEEEQPEPADDVVQDNENELQDEEFYRV